MMDSFHPLGPHDPPLLPLADKQTPAPLDLEASRSRNRTHSDISETPTIACPEHHEPQRQIGQEDLLFKGEQLAIPPAASQFICGTNLVGEPQAYDFWNKLRQCNLVLWLDYTEEATSYHTHST